MPIITLLTDFGTADSYVGEVKGVLLSSAPHAMLVDITHQIPPGNLRAASYVFARTWKRFPSGTIHLVVLDPGVGTERAALAVRAASHFFVGPDNGVFTSVFAEVAADILALPVPAGASSTFHGRDVFAPAAAALANTGWSPALGSRFNRSPHLLSSPSPRSQGGVLEGEVIYVDHFGNLISNLKPEDIEDADIVWLNEVKIGPLRSTYGQVQPGELLVYFGSGGALEIAVRDGSAAERLGASIGSRIRVQRE
jgi:S-adenosylmethionine hydrolase